MAANISVLSTAPLPAALIDKAATAGIALDAIPFIIIEYVKDNSIAQELEELATLPLTAVFTSAHAVRAVVEGIHSLKPEWNIYCTGNATMKEVQGRLPTCTIKGTADDAATLAGLIIADDVQEVVFFCGDRRLDTLPGLLYADEISVHEMVVYNTFEVPRAAMKAYDGILFFSPSGVHSFFRANTVGHATVLFAIGNTTAMAIKALSGNKVVVGGEQTKDALVGCAIEYFEKTSGSNIR